VAGASSERAHRAATRADRPRAPLLSRLARGATLARAGDVLETVDRIAKTLSDMTIGTMIVLFHVTLADRQRRRALPELRDSSSDGTRVWRSQISP
jgi:hypothetical protein